MTTILRNRLIATTLSAVSFSALVACVDGQVVTYYGQPAPPAVIYPAAQAPAQYYLSAEQIDQLTGPIALYPDPLLAQLLPAATYPDDIAAAADFLQRYPQPTEDAINGAPWDASVKAIMHYPTVLQQMAGNMEWTQALGLAFVNQPQDVMDSIQRLRAQAQAAGNLYATPEQQVVVDPYNCIEILPAQPNFVYVPVYDPLVIFIGRDHHERFHDNDRYRIRDRDDYGFDWRNHWVGRGYDWSNYRAGHPVERRADATARPWVRDNRRPLPVMPQKYVRPADSRDYRGYPNGPQVSGHGAFDPNANRKDTERSSNRGHDSVPNQNNVRPTPTPPHVDSRNATPQPTPRVDPRTVTPAPQPTPRVDPRVEAPHVAPPPPAPRVEQPHAAPPPPAPRAEPPHVAPAPAPRAEPPHVAPAPPAPRAEPPHAAPPPPSAPREAPSAPPAPAFRPGSGGDTNQQSDRGHGSMKH